ncbi:acriflavin resistance protein [Perkinsela sp. CCAP 1560/4]|nr:acriflavin resistance protein [Perkinsela sp. CCAP 1560/4]|eukprot:KNH08064.1 acriflavin resistance protein [Perkinsela sp. CCAP 1560/4]
MLPRILVKVRYCSFSVDDAHQVVQDIISIGVPVLPVYDKVLRRALENIDPQQPLQFLKKLKGERPNEMLEKAITRLVSKVCEKDIITGIDPQAPSILKKEAGPRHIEVTLENLMIVFNHLVGKEIRSADDNAVEYYATRERNAASSLSHAEKSTLRAVVWKLLDRSAQLELAEIIRIAVMTVSIHERAKGTNGRSFRKVSRRVFARLLGHLDTSEDILHLDCSNLFMAFVTLTTHLLDEFAAKQCRVILSILKELTRRDKQARSLGMTRIGLLEISVNHLFQGCDHDTTLSFYRNEIYGEVIAILHNRVADCSMDLCLKSVILMTRMKTVDRAIVNSFFDEIQNKFSSATDAANIEVKQIKGTGWVTLLFCMWKLALFNQAYHSFVASRILEAFRDKSLQLSDTYKSIVYFQKMKYESKGLAFEIINTILCFPSEIDWTALISSCRCMRVLHNLQEVRTHPSYQKSLDFLKNRIRSWPNLTEQNVSLTDAASLLFVLSFHSQEVGTTVRILEHFLRLVDTTKEIGESDSEDNVVVEIICMLRSFNTSPYRKFFAEHHNKLHKLYLQSLRMPKDSAINHHVRVVSSVCQIAPNDKLVRQEITKILQDMPRRIHNAQMTDRSVGVLLIVLAKHFTAVESSVFVALLDYMESDCLPQKLRTSISVLQACSIQGTPPGRILYDHIMQQISTHPSSLGNSELTIVFRALWQLKMQPSNAMLRAIKESIRQGCSTMHIHNCSIILRTLCRVDCGEDWADFFTAFYRAIEDAMGRDQAVRPSNLIRIVSSISVSRFRSDRLENRIFTYLSNDAVILDIRTLHSSWIVELHEAMQKLNSHTKFPKLHKAIIKLVKR